MRRGDIYRVHRPGGPDPKHFRIYVVVSRNALAHFTYPTMICAPIYSRAHGIQTEVTVGIDEGLKHPSVIACDNLVSLEKSKLTDYVGSLSPDKLHELDLALCVALDIGSA